MVPQLFNGLLLKTHPYNLGQLLDYLEDTSGHLRIALIWPIFA